MPFGWRIEGDFWVAEYGGFRLLVREASPGEWTCRAEHGDMSRQVTVDGDGSMAAVAAAALADSWPVAWVVETRPVQEPGAQSGAG